ncbi:MAG TPA: ribonuclease P protein component [Planctomycetota bacterium]|nr:ribonuclease P protein component [Planctomycetota bacterium]
MSGRPPRRRVEGGLPRPARLRRRAEFEAVYAAGHKLVEARVVAFVVRAAERASGCRLGLSVSRKVGNAPTRNRVKRVLRDAFRKLAPACSEPLDLILVARPGKAPASAAEAHESLSRVLDRWRRSRRA